MLSRREAQKILKHAEARGLGNDPKVVAIREYLAETKDAAITRRCRLTGTKITVCTAEDAGAGHDGETEGLPWYTVCETHSTCVGHETKTLALSHAAMPAWCEECQQILNGEAPKEEN
jgi:hypothetical protein